MNPTAIYSKSGKGVQEASGKTSSLSRADRAVLAAIDGRATVAAVAEKCGKPYDPAFEALITQLETGGYIREVSPGVAPAGPPKPAPAAKPGKPARPEPATPLDPGSDLDFSSFAPPPTAATPQKSAADSLHQARLEAEARAQKERERVKAEAEAKIRAETEARLRAEAAKKSQPDMEAKLRAEADAKVKAAREAAVRAAAEAKAKADAERARLEAERAKLEQERARAEAERKEAQEKAERARKEAEEKAEQARKEAEAKARREAEELRRKLEEERARAEAERKAREEAERKAREEAERKATEEIERARREAEEKAKREAEALRKQLEEERRQLEEERKRRDEEDRKRREQEERARKEAEERARKEAEERRKKEEEERAERRRKEDAERKEREEAARKEREREEAARREREEAERRRQKEEAAAKAALEAKAAADAKLAAEAKAAAAKPAAPAGDFSDSLLADLDSFDKRDDDARKEKEAAERRAKEDAERRAREEADRKAREEAERKAKAEAERRQREEAERRQREEEEERQRKSREALEARRSSQAAAPAVEDDDIGVTDDDLDMEDVKEDERALSATARKAARQREKEAEREEPRAPEPVAAAPEKARRPIKWGKSVALALFVLLAAGIGAIHVMPISTAEYESAATEALRVPVRIGSARLSLFSGVQLRLEKVTVGDANLGTVRAFPEIGALFGPRKAFTRIELDGPIVPQAGLGGLLLAKAKGERFSVARLVATKARLEGPLVLPPLDADIAFGADGAVRNATLRGPEGLLAKLAAKDADIEFDVTASTFTLPVAPQVTLANFAMKGTATRDGMNITAWDGAALDGAVAGTATLKWGSSWDLQGAFTVRSINAAVLAPALLSEGRAEGTGRFSMTGAEPAKLLSGGRVEGTFTVNKGVLGSFDLSRAIQTGGRQVAGRTQFAEMTGQGLYDKGTVSLRNVTIGAGALNAGASADINPAGALTGRIVADVRTATQTLRASLTLGGTVKDPQVKN